jgi:hypothetical protein
LGEKEKGRTYVEDRDLGADGPGREDDSAERGGAWPRAGARGAEPRGQLDMACDESGKLRGNDDLR